MFFFAFFFNRAPEVILGHPYDTRIDIWSIGAVAAEMLTGYVLFQNDSVASMLSRITGTFPSASPIRAGTVPCSALIKHEPFSSAAFRTSYIRLAQPC
jgi:serine/threonine protein kinase